MPTNGDQHGGRAGPAQFATTRWSLVLTAGRDGNDDSRDALAELCEAYWLPVYTFVRHRVGDVHRAQDLTQEFFQRLLEKNTIAQADPRRGRFRAFLLAACKNFLVNQWHKSKAEKRGGGRAMLSLDLDAGESHYAAQAVDRLTPEQLFEQQWAIGLLARVLEQLKAEYVAKDKLRHFDGLKQFLSGPKPTESYASAAEALGMSEGAVKVAGHRMRKRYRELLRKEIAQTVETPEEIDDEIRSLFAVLGSEKNADCL